MSEATATTVEVRSFSTNLEKYRFPSTTAIVGTRGSGRTDLAKYLVKCLGIDRANVIALQPGYDDPSSYFDTDNQFVNCTASECEVIFDWACARQSLLAAKDAVIVMDGGEAVFCKSQAFRKACTNGRKRGLSVIVTCSFLMDIPLQVRRGLFDYLCFFPKCFKSDLRELREEILGGVYALDNLFSVLKPREAIVVKRFFKQFEALFYVDSHAT